MQHQQFNSATKRVQNTFGSTQKQWILKQQVNKQQWTTQETILKEEVQQTAKDILEEQKSKEKSTGEDSGQSANLLWHRGWTKEVLAV